MEKEIFYFIYKTALRDAVMRTAYTGDRKKLLENKKAHDATKEYIDAVLDGKHPNFYEAAEKVEKKFGDKEFTFGNTQKLINMCVKYAYIATYNNKELRENFRDCHCPMDGSMVEKVIEKIEDRAKDVLAEDYIRGWRGFLRQPWSRMERDKKQYEVFQNVVKKLAEEEDKVPIEYDYKYWKKRG